MRHPVPANRYTIIITLPFKCRPSVIRSVVRMDELLPAAGISTQIKLKRRLMRRNFSARDGPHDRTMQVFRKSDAGHHRILPQKPPSNVLNTRNIFVFSHISRDHHPGIFLFIRDDSSLPCEWRRTTIRKHAKRVLTHFTRVHMHVVMYIRIVDNCHDKYLARPSECVRHGHRVIIPDDHQFCQTRPSFLISTVRLVRHNDHHFISPNGYPQHPAFT